MDDLKIKIGNKIKNLRNSENLSLRELGEKIQINYSHLGRLERGNEPSIKLLEKIANYFKVDISYFFVDDEKNQTIEWLEFLQEVNEKNISISDLRNIISMMEKLKTKNYE